MNVIKTKFRDLLIIQKIHLMITEIYKRIILKKLIKKEFPFDITSL